MINEDVRVALVLLALQSLHSSLVRSPSASLVLTRSVPHPESLTAPGITNCCVLYLVVASSGKECPVPSPRRGTRKKPERTGCWGRMCIPSQHMEETMDEAIFYQLESMFHALNIVSLQLWILITLVGLVAFFQLIVLLFSGMALVKKDTRKRED